MINHIVLEGRVVKNAELKSAGTSTVTTFTIANNQSYQKNGEWINKACFIDCNIWGEYGNTMHQYLNRGQKLTVEGILEQNNWEDSNGNKRSSFRVKVSNISIQWDKKDNNSVQNNAAIDSNIPPTNYSTDFPPVDSGENPFN